MSPDVYLFVDRQTGDCPKQDGSSLPLSVWTSAKDLVLLPGAMREGFYKASGFFIASYLVCSQ